MKSKQYRFSRLYQWTILILLLVLTTTVLAQSSRQTTEQALADANVPPRDLGDLAQRLNGVTDIPEAPTTPIRVYQEGDTDQFWVHKLDDDVIQVTARLIYMNDVVYMWVQEGYSVDRGRVQIVADRFASEIYQPVRDVFGNEASPGIDGDPRLHILHTDQLGSGVAGYFYSISEYPQAAISSSNQREMFFISVGMLNSDSNYYLSVLAHEFQHMIHWAVDANEESWLNEGLGELAAFVAGFEASPFSTSFLNRSNIQLNYWPEGDTRPVYGGAFLFSAYILERYGIDAVQMLVADPENGMAGVQSMLDELGAIDPLTGEPMTAEALFAEWSMTNYLNDTQVLDGRYGYQNQALQQFGSTSSVERFSQLPINLPAASVNQWATRYYSLPITQDTLHISFQGNDTVPIIPAEAHSGDYAFWSNRVDSSDTRLTREFDLTAVDRATLSFWTWYDIEAGWDYAYLVVSTDGGQTWDIIPTGRTTDWNPHGTSYGQAYTDSSGGWIQETVDLSAYAGQRILVRFEYITDDATLRDGMVIDDVAIPEIDYFTDFEQPDDSWIAEGWVLMDNTLHQTFGVHLVQRSTDSSATITRLLLSGDVSQNEWDVSLEPNVHEVILVVSGFAPVTTQPGIFDLHIQ